MLRFNREISGVDFSQIAEGQLESPLIMCLKFRKVKQFFKNNLQKILKTQKKPENRDFFIKKLFYFFLGTQIKIVQIPQKMIRFFAFFPIRYPIRCVKICKKTTPKGGYFLEPIHKSKFYDWVIWIIFDFFTRICQSFVFCSHKFIISRLNNWVSAIFFNQSSICITQTVKWYI